MAQHSTTSPASPPSSTGTTPTQENSLSVPDNGRSRHLPSSVLSTNVFPLVVIGRKRPAPAEFDEDVSMPHRKKYITGWMSEYIRLRAPSWREMLRVMQEARWRPFRPQVIPYLAPAPPPAPSAASCYGCADPVTGDSSVETTVRESFSFRSYSNFDDLFDQLLQLIRRNPHPHPLIASVFRCLPRHSNADHIRL